MMPNDGLPFFTILFINFKELETRPCKMIYMSFVILANKEFNEKLFINLILEFNKQLTRQLMIDNYS